MCVSVEEEGGGERRESGDLGEADSSYSYSPVTSASLDANDMTFAKIEPLHCSSL